VYAHSVLQRAKGLGYLSSWAESKFEKTDEKNEFYNHFGRLFNPKQADKLENLTPDINPEQILKIIC
ncbi:MAG: hypothetical protein ACYTEE_08765, partial [Planctomycetota bacterium]